MHAHCFAAGFVLCFSTGIAMAAPLPAADNAGHRHATQSSDAVANPTRLVAAPPAEAGQDAELPEPVSLLLVSLGAVLVARLARRAAGPGQPNR